MSKRDVAIRRTILPLPQHMADLPCFADKTDLMIGHIAFHKFALLGVTSELIYNTAMSRLDKLCL